MLAGWRFMKAIINKYCCLTFFWHDWHWFWCLIYFLTFRTARLAVSGVGTLENRSDQQILLFNIIFRRLAFILAATIFFYLFNCQHTQLGVLAVITLEKRSKKYSRLTFFWSAWHWFRRSWYFQSLEPPTLPGWRVGGLAACRVDR